MTAPAPDIKQVRASWFSRSLRWVLASLRSLLFSLLVIWTTLAVYYSNLPWAWLRLVLAVAFAAFSVWALWLTRRPRMRWAFGGLFLVVLIWFITIRPSHDRPWRPEVAVMPRRTSTGTACASPGSATSTTAAGTISPSAGKSARCPSPA
jgi:hypothetical protein